MQQQFIVSYRNEVSFQKHHNRTRITTLSEMQNSVDSFKRSIVDDVGSTDILCILVLSDRWTNIQIYK